MNDLTLYLTAVLLLGVLLYALTVLGVELVKPARDNRRFDGKERYWTHNPAKRNKHHGG